MSETEIIINVICKGCDYSELEIYNNTKRYCCCKPDQICIKDTEQNNHE